MKKMLTLMSALLLAGGAMAQSTWTMGNGSASTCAVTGSGTGTIIDNCGTTGLNTAGVKFDAIGVSLSTSAGTFARSTLTNQGTSGIGADEATGETSPAHAFDNINGENVEMLFLSFDQAVKLSQVRIGWWSGDADISVYKWVGTAPTATEANLTGVTAGALPSAPTSFDVRNATTTTTSNGWRLVQSADLASSPNDTMNMTADGTVTASSWWLISAFLGSTGIGDDASAKVTDYFKLLSVSACTTGQTGGACGSTTTKVPAPMTAALVGLALLGGAGARRFGRKG